MIVKPVAGTRAFQLTLPYRGAQRRRNFFNFTNFPSTDSSLHKGSETHAYHERRIFPYRSSELYKVVADVASYSHFIPYCVRSMVLESDTSPDGTTVMEAELTINFLAFKESYVSTVTCKPNESVEAVVSSSSPLLKTLNTIWRLKPVSSSPLSSTPLLSQETSTSNIVSRDDGPTLVTLDLAFAFVSPVHAAAFAAFSGQVSKILVNAFEQRCIALYGRRTG